MSDLATFLRARIDEDEAAAREAGGGRWESGSWALGDGPDGLERQDDEAVSGEGFTIYKEGGHTVEQARHIARWDPARVLAEVEAKRMLIRRFHQPGFHAPNHLACPGCFLLRALARPYADHPDFDPAWRT